MSERINYAPTKVGGIFSQMKRFSFHLQTKVWSFHSRNAIISEVNEKKPWQSLVIVNKIDNGAAKKKLNEAGDLSKEMSPNNCGVFSPNQEPRRSALRRLRRRHRNRAS
jgi:hypothetical protein